MSFSSDLKLFSAVAYSLASELEQGDSSAFSDEDFVLLEKLLTKMEICLSNMRRILRLRLFGSFRVSALGSIGDFYREVEALIGLDRTTEQSSKPGSKGQA